MNLSKIPYIILLDFQVKILKIFEVILGAILTNHGTRKMHLIDMNEAL